MPRRLGVAVFLKEGRSSECIGVVSTVTIKHGQLKVTRVAGTTPTCPECLSFSD
jgi:hypothetical protein